MFQKIANVTEKNNAPLSLSVSDEMSKDCLSILYNTCVCVSISSVLCPHMSYSVFTDEAGMLEWGGRQENCLQIFKGIALIFCVPKNQNQQVEIMERLNFVALRAPNSIACQHPLTSGVQAETDHYLLKADKCWQSVHIL